MLLFKFYMQKGVNTGTRSAMDAAAISVIKFFKQ